MHSYQFLDDIAVADLAFKAEGDSVEELFRAATEALLETLADPATVAMTWEGRIEHVWGALDELLFEWLSDLVYWKDAQGVVFHEADLSVVFIIQERLIVRDNRGFRHIGPGNDYRSLKGIFLGSHHRQRRKRNAAEWTVDIIFRDIRAAFVTNHWSKLQLTIDPES